MSTWLSFVTSGFAGPVCLVVSAAGLVLSALAWRRKGARSGIRGIAWSLLPAAAWLTHALALLGRIVSAIVQFGAGFVLSPKAWLGIIFVGVSAVLFLVSGGIPMLQRGRRREKLGRGRKSGTDTPQVAGPTTRQQPAIGAGEDDELSDVRDILKRHGIT